MALESTKDMGQKAHYEAISQTVCCPIHRRSFFKGLGGKSAHEKRLPVKAGEDHICQWLKGQGYIIVARNYHSRYGEIDIIAQKDRTWRLWR